MFELLAIVDAVFGLLGHIDGYKARSVLAALRENPSVISAGITERGRVASLERSVSH